MNIKILLSCTAALAIACGASADQVQVTSPVTDESVTTRIPGSLDIEPQVVVSPSFDPMPADRGPCHTMVLTSTPVESPAYSSFARMPDTRHPTVACAVAPVPVQVAVLEPPPAKRAEPPPVEQPYVALVAPPVVIAELPHTASMLPWVGLLGLLSLGGAVLVRAGRSVLS